MQNETPEQEAAQARETARFRTVIGCGLVLALAFGLLNLTGVIHV